MREEDNATPKKNKWLIGAGIAIVLYVISLFVPYLSNVTKYPFYFAKCGGQPITAMRFAAAYSYTRPGDAIYNTFADEYFCIEQEAQSAGFRARN